MIWIKPPRGSYHLLRGRSFMCGVRIDIDAHYQIDSSYDPPGDERCKNCMRSIDHIHHSAHLHNDYSIDKVVYRYGKHPMIFTNKLIIFTSKLIVCKDFGKIERTFTDVWIQQSGEVDDMPLMGAIAVYSIHKKGHIDTENPEIIRIENGRYYKFE